MYQEQSKLNLCNKKKQMIATNVYVTLFKGLSLTEYIQARKFFCQSTHCQPCLKCTNMIQVASSVLKDGYMLLSFAFKKAYPTQTYKSDIAILRFLQMPLAAVRIGTPESGMAKWFLLEFVCGVDYTKFAHFAEAGLLKNTDSKKPNMTKSEVQQLLKLAGTDRDRELIRYSVYMMSGLAPSRARKEFGFDSIAERAARVEECIKEAQTIRESIDKVADIRDKALLITMGLQDCELCLSDSDSNSESDTEPDLFPATTALPNSFPVPEKLKEILDNAHYNFFEAIENLELVCGCKIDFHELYLKLLSLPLNTHERGLLERSFSSYKASLADYPQVRDEDALNGYIVSDSDSDNPEDYIGITSIQSERAKKLIFKKRKSLAQKMRRWKAKKIVERNFLSRKTSMHVNSILKQFPEIGKDIESFVADSNVGAEAWRRTGMLTFDGNLKIDKKVTYERIRQHLQEKYSRSFSYGTVVQLCVARNKKRRSATNYKGAALVTTRRARKGFELKYNPDNHWSAALYKGLNQIQYTDGSDITIINRDDASGFRLDTLTTHSKHGAPTVAGKELLTTHTDYVNRYPSLLQTTSYNFTATKTTPEFCAGVVKGSKVYPKNPTQHYSDLVMLSQQKELVHAFKNNGIPKRIECIRVDGATDEGPSHDEVRFWWTFRHLKHGKLATLVSSRSSGCSYLNRVELQNGCLALGHTNLFIPSTLGGTVFNSETGLVDMDKVKTNLDLATDVYISRVDKSPCGDTVIHLFKGADSSSLQAKREDLITFLKGSKKNKDKLKVKKPEVYAEFEQVWAVKQRHEVGGLPPQYLFLLVCCFETGCPHPICRAGKKQDLVWYPNGPSLYSIPFPRPDLTRPWGSTSCTDCKGFCAGHFTKPDDSSDTPQMKIPPSSILKDFHSKLMGKEPTDDELTRVAKDILLPPGEVKIWLDHLTTVAENRKRGAAKAAKTRRKKSQKSNTTTTNYYCGVCEAEYGASEESEYWIGCDSCDTWFHGDCVHITKETEPDTFYCCLCV